MTDTLSYDLDRADVELLIQEGKYEEAKSHLSQYVERIPFDREAALYLLLVNVSIRGSEYYEDEIDELRTLFDLHQTEKDIIRRIFLIGHREAEERGREQQVWAYQRLLRRLLLDQPLDQPIPKGANHRQTWTSESVIELAPKKSAKSWASRQSRTTRSARRRFVRFASIPRRAQHAALLIPAVGFLAMPLIYFLFTHTYPMARPAVATSHRTLASAKDHRPVAAAVPATEQQSEEAKSKREKTLHTLVPALLANLRSAYSQRIREHPHLQGRLLLRLRIDGTGHVTQADELASQLGDTEFVNALIREAQAWKFPKDMVDAGEIIVPLLFVPEGNSAAAVAPPEDTLTHAQAKKPVPTPVQTVRAVPVTEKRRKVQNVTPKAKTKSDEIAAAAIGSLRQSGPASTIGIAKTRQPITLREDPRFAANTVDRIAGGIPVHVLEVRGSWLKVRSGKAETVGFVRREFLTPIQ